MDAENQNSTPKRKRAEPATIDAKTFIELCYESIQKDKEKTDYPTFGKSELDMLVYLLFHKDPEFRVWIIKKKDKRVIKELIEHQEGQRRGVLPHASSLYQRRMKFFKEFIGSGFNAAEAARRCGYSHKYAKQIGYRIRRKLY